MNFHLDTNAAIAVLKANGSSVDRRVHKAMEDGDAVAISAIVLFELWFGVAKSGRWEENAGRLRQFLASIDVVSFDEQDTQAAGEIRATLGKAGTPIGPYDLLIAAHAVRRGATLVTANVREFSKVPGLVWEDWGAA